MEIALLILAAGNSSRMKTCKQLLTINDSTLLEHAIHQALQAHVSHVYCVLGANAEKIQQHLNFDGVHVVINQNWKEGLSASIVEGVKQFSTNDSDAVLIMLADQPFVTTNYLNTLINEFNKYPDHIVASNYGIRLGVPAIFPKCYLDKLLILKGDKGAREFLNTEGLKIMSVASQGNLVDIDTPEDYKKLLNNT